MNRDQIIAAQSELILRLLRIGQEELQEVTNLFCEIEKLPKEEEGIKISEYGNVVNIQNHLTENKKGICPICKNRPKMIFKSGIMSSYCSVCNNIKQKEYREKGIRK
jgi:hypothetical protein